MKITVIPVGTFLNSLGNRIGKRFESGIVDNSSDTGDSSGVMNRFAVTASVLSHSQFPSSRHLPEIVVLLQHKMKRN